MFFADEYDKYEEEGKQESVLNITRLSNAVG
jgi:hypothetical protein